MAVGYWYHAFEQLTDEEVLELLERAAHLPDAQAAAASGTLSEERPDPESTPPPAQESAAAVAERSVQIPAGAAILDGDLAVAEGARGVVLFAHGSGSGRLSPRNRAVAEVLRAAGLATLLLDLLPPDEARVDAETREHRFDIGRLAERLVAAVDWLAQHPDTCALPVGLFGASTGAAAAPVAAAERPRLAGAAVSRAGRPDLAGAALPRRPPATPP